MMRSGPFSEASSGLSTFWRTRDIVRRRREQSENLSSTLFWMRPSKRKHGRNTQQLFRQNGLRCDLCLDYNKVLEHPQFKALDLITEIEHPVRGKIRTFRPLKEFKWFPRPQHYRHPPILGEHKEKIFSELVYSSQEIEKLNNTGVVRIAAPDMLNPKAVEKGPPVSIDLGKGVKKKAKKNKRP